MIFGKPFEKRTYSLSVGFNQMGDGANGLPSPYRVVTKYSDLTQPGPSKTLTFFDMNEFSIDSGVFTWRWEGDQLATDRWEHMPTDRHAGGANLAYADGSVRYKRWLHPKVFKEFGQKVANEKDLADLEWTKEGLPRR